ncbi:MAG TPA: hypothetical protein VHK26_02910 [Methyloceanibacter sp.]|nr:hypothetical protein [Methyloceanibacter sp.]
MLAAVIAILLLFGARMFSDEKSVDVNVAPPSTEAPATGETPKP